MRKWTFILTVAAAVAGGATSASAVSFDFNSCHIATGCGALPYGTVTLTQVDADSDGVQDDVLVSVSGPNFTFFAATGAMDKAFFAFNGTGVSASDIVNETTTPGLPAGTTLQGFAGTFSGRMAIQTSGLSVSRLHAQLMAPQLVDATAHRKTSKLSPLTF